MEIRVIWFLTNKMIVFDGHSSLQAVLGYMSDNDYKQYVKDIYKSDVLYGLAFVHHLIAFQI